MVHGIGTRQLGPPMNANGAAHLLRYRNGVLARMRAFILQAAARNDEADLDDCCS
jgi:hypothetical protein